MQYRKEICADLKIIYGAVNLDDAEYAKEEFREKWDRKYQSILRFWDANWEELTTFFSYLEQIRHLIYTTNAVKAYHRMVRKFTKTKSIFPTDDSIRMSRRKKSPKSGRSHQGIGQWRIARFWYSLQTGSQLKTLKALPSNSRGLSAKGLLVNWKTGESESSPINRISRSKRWSAPQQCPIYTVVWVLAI